MSSLSGSGTSALLDVIIATLRCQKSEKKGDLYSLAFPAGTDREREDEELGQLSWLSDGPKKSQEEDARLSFQWDSMFQYV
jgi:hypothetical protein